MKVLKKLKQKVIKQIQNKMHCKKLCIKIKERGIEKERNIVAATSCLAKPEQSLARAQRREPQLSRFGLQESSEAAVVGI
jgi:hypothetical protein